jgi:N-acetylglucosaminyl-diphospho-decaprenol L-rhamnosyltransferase
VSGPAVDVVVLTWNDGWLLTKAVDSALDSTGVDVAVFVIDNGSDPPVNMTGASRVTLVRNEVNRGVAAARNQGVALGSAQIVCLLDSDARLEPDCLARLADAVLSDSSVALAAPVFVNQLPAASAGRAPTLGRKAARLLGRSSTYATVATTGPSWDVDFAIGACQLVRRDAFAEIGGLDASYFYGPEDVDFCLRLREVGWRVLQVRDAQCHHPPRRRFRRPFSRKGVAHALAVLRHLWRHRRFRGISDGAATPGGSHGG